MMKKSYLYMAVAGLALMTTPVWASGVPVYSFSELVEMTVDQFKGADTRRMVRTEKELVKKTFKDLGGSIIVDDLEQAYNQSLSAPSPAVTPYAGLQTVLGINSELGQIKVRNDGETTDEIVERLATKVFEPASEGERLTMTTMEKRKRAAVRAEALENSGTSNLAKAWSVQAETANTAESLKNIDKEMKKVNSQMGALALIVKNKEETLKNMLTRTSMTADDLINTGLITSEYND